jgi:co-chaperonin GroES (HSP10)
MIPLHDFVLVEPLPEDQQKSPSGLFMVFDSGVRRATVLAAGRGRVRDGCFVETPVKPGQVVLFRIHDGVSVSSNRLLVEANDLLATE